MTERTTKANLYLLQHILKNVGKEFKIGDTVFFKEDFQVHYPGVFYFDVIKKGTLATITDVKNFKSGTCYLVETIINDEKKELFGIKAISLIKVA